MISVSNIRIGTKLTVMSGLGIWLVAGMLISQWFGNAAIETADESAARQREILDPVMPKYRSAETRERGAKLASLSEPFLASVQNGATLPYEIIQIGAQHAPVAAARLAAVVEEDAATVTVRKAASAVRPAAAAYPVGRMQVALATALDADTEWKDF